MATNNPRDPRNQRNPRNVPQSRRPQNVPPSRRPQEWHAKRDVPPAVIAIYVVMVILILAICAIVFAVTMNNAGSSSVPYPSGIPGPAASPGSSEESSTPQSSASQSTPQSSVSQSTPQSSVSQSSTASSDNWTSQMSSNWTVITTNPNSEPVGPETNLALSTEYSKDFFDNDLFIGDSIFTGLSGYGFLSADNVAAKIGYTPSAAMNKAFDAKGLSAVEYAKQRQPERIYIMLGSNTMAAGTNYDVIVSQYGQLVAKLKEDCPDSKICVISIPPVTKDSSSAKAGNITNENIRMVNTKLITMTENSQVDYFNLNGLLSDKDGFFLETFAEQDGLHFMGKTYKVLLSALQHKYNDTVTVTVIRN